MLNKEICKRCLKSNEHMREEVFEEDWARKLVVCPVMLSHFFNSISNKPPADCFYLLEQTISCT